MGAARGAKHAHRHTSERPDIHAHTHTIQRSKIQTSTHGLEDAFVACVVDAVAERKVDGVVLAHIRSHVLRGVRKSKIRKKSFACDWWTWKTTYTALKAHNETHTLTHLDVAGAGKILAVLVEGHCHHTVGAVEGLLHAVAVVDVNVDVQHALEPPARVRLSEGQRREARALEKERERKCDMQTEREIERARERECV
jgi:hypothetical protein